jgi:hypothetical protein
MRWRVNYGNKHIGTIEAPDETSAIAEAMRTYCAVVPDQSN